MVLINLILVTSSLNACEPVEGLSLSQSSLGSVWSCRKDNIVALLLLFDFLLMSCAGVKGGLHRRRGEEREGRRQKGTFGKMPSYR